MELEAIVPSFHSAREGRKVISVSGPTILEQNSILKLDMSLTSLDGDSSFLRAIAEDLRRVIWRHITTRDSGELHTERSVDAARQDNP